MAEGGSDTEERGMLTDRKSRDFMMLHAALLIYSFGGIFQKMASLSRFLSVGFIVWYLLLQAASMVYIIGWQDILKRMPLNTAYANKSIVIVWGILWGKLVFGERITPNMVVGSLIIFAGILLVVSADG